MSEQQKPLISRDELNDLCQECLDTINQAVGKLKERIETLYVERVQEFHPEVTANPDSFPAGLVLNDYPVTPYSYALGCDLPEVVFWQFIRMNEVHDVVIQQLKQSKKRKRSGNEIKN